MWIFVGFARGQITNQEISRSQFVYSKIISPNCLPISGLLFTIAWIVDKPYCTVSDDHTDWCPEQSGDSELTGHSAAHCART